MSHQNCSGLNLDLRAFFLSPCIFTPGSHLFCSFPWDSCSCSEICLAGSCSWTNPLSLTAVAPFPLWQATAGLLPVCQQLSCAGEPNHSSQGWAGKYWTQGKITSLSFLVTIFLLQEDFRNALWAKNEPCTPNCQCTHWSKTITSWCFVYCHANLRARSLASDLQWKNSVIASLWMSWVLKYNLLCTVLQRTDNSMHVMHKFLSNQHSLGRTVHQNRIHLKKPEYKNYCRNNLAFFSSRWSLLRNMPRPQQKQCIGTFENNSQVRRQIRQETNTVNIDITV